jgi:hypothetical protein
LYRHYKGENYRVLMVAEDSNNEGGCGPIVVYISCDGNSGRVWYRRMSEFLATVGYDEVPIRLRRHLVPTSVIHRFELLEGQ